MAASYSATVLGTAETTAGSPLDDRARYLVSLVDLRDLSRQRSTPQAEGTFGPITWIIYEYTLDVGHNTMQRGSIEVHDAPLDRVMQSVRINESQILPFEDGSKIEHLHHGK
ncbi:hypothetical protein MMC24_001437 [Lignoscripta atroalba]|nr:hypothetical protein [Lignoscripta atroalba]